MHAALQPPAPARESEVHAKPSEGQLVAHAPVPVVIAVSHVSPPLTVPSPQVPVQSASAPVPPGGQQPSPAISAVISVVVQIASHVPSFESMSVVHALPSSHALGHAPADPAAMPVSQVSPLETTPSPHAMGQSESSASVSPARQHPSPSAAAVIGVD
jgi:hypothetical protein